MSTVTAFVAAFDAKALNDTESLNSYLAGGNRIINCHSPQANQPKCPQLKTLTKHMVYVFFYKNHICFSYLCLKKTNTLHLYSMCGGM